MKRGRRVSAVLAGVLFAAGVVEAATGTGTFVEPDVEVLQTFASGDPTAYFGWAISELGDVDRDGIMEAMVGAPGRSSTARGAVWVFSGRTGKRLYRFRGDGTDRAGYALADAGDVDADGVADILIGAPGGAVGGPGAGRGRVCVRSGRNGHRIGCIRGLADGDSFGAAVASAGDVNHDGHADLLVGAPDSDASGATSGQAYVYSGKTLRLIRVFEAERAGDSFGSATDWTADVDGDSVPDQVVGARDAGGGQRGRAYVYSGATGRLLRTIDPPPSGVDLGWFFVAGVGDTNRDGIPDLYAGDFDDDGTDFPRGRAAVYSGDDVRELQAWVGELTAGMGPGREAGDVDADGAVDLAVGSYTSSAGGDNAGRIQIFSGLTGGELRRITSTTAGERLGFDAVGLGDVNRDGIPDLLGSAASGETVYLFAGRRG